MASSLSIVRQGPSLGLSRKKRMEADVYRLLAQEKDHKRRAEEHRIRATCHNCKALVLRMRVVKVETELTHPNDEESG
jgi:hypothetical protein